MGMERKIRQKAPEKVWADFKQQEGLTDNQLKKFQAYEALLSEWNKKINLTAIRGLSETVHRHFSDSLILGKFIELSKVKVIVDVGSGGGFPGLPLKIMFPHLGLILIEVSKKKQDFLKAVVSALELENVDVCGIDWRTFLRTTEGDIDYFLARSSLDQSELARMFKPGCTYKNSKLIYWASEEWEPDKLIAHFVKDNFLYSIKRKKRKLVLMGL
jgi:16S rRNA (guanine(527)-N(7))-methyltransferase RsmG